MLRRILAVALATGLAGSGWAQTPMPPQSSQGVGRGPAACDPGAAAKFVCGLRNPEDLIIIPGTDWIVGSQWIMNGSGNGGLFLIDRKTHAATILPAPAGAAKKPFDQCPGSPDMAKLSTHGLNIRPAGAGRFTLFAVSHTVREAVEVFDVKVQRQGPPAVTWQGCIMAPAGAYFNAVAPLSGGRLIATNFYQAPLTLADAQRGTITGAVYLWKPGGAFEKLPGTELAGGNGVEVTKDGKYVFAAEWGKSTIKRYEIAHSDRAAWSLALPFRIDNVRWAPNGGLLMAGPGAAANCAPGARCPMVPMVAELDPKSLRMTMIKQGPAEPSMGAISTALVVGDELWTGSYGGDRVAYQALPKP